VHLSGGASQLDAARQGYEIHFHVAREKLCTRGKFDPLALRDAFLQPLGNFIDPFSPRHVFS